MLTHLAFLLFLPFAPPDSRTVVLEWSDSLNPSGTTYTIKKSTGKCSGSTTFSDIAVGITIKSYSDEEVSPGQYCYTVVATLGTSRSENAEPISVKVDKK